MKKTNSTYGTCANTSWIGSVRQNIYVRKETESKLNLEDYKIKYIQDISTQSKIIF